MTRAEHLEWVKKRARAELDGTPAGVARAAASVTSDLGKHPDTRGHDAVLELHMLLVQGYLVTDHQARRFIEGIR